MKSAASASDSPEHVTTSMATWLGRKTPWRPRVGVRYEDATLRSEG